MMIGLHVLGLLLACPHQVGPVPLFADPVPELQAPKPLEAKARATDCPDYESFTVGELVPWTREGRATCNAQIVPPVRVAGWLYNEEISDYWRRVAEISQYNRELDRAHAQTELDTQHRARRALEQDVRALRLAVPAVAVGALLVGVATGILADAADESHQP